MQKDLLGLAVLLVADTAAVPTVASPTLERMIPRGDAFLGTADTVSARLFYERAAAQGSAAAMARLGDTYDPLFLAEAQIPSVPADPAKAPEWYRKATAAGNPDAATGLRRLMPKAILEAEDDEDEDEDDDAEPAPADVTSAPKAPEMAPLTLTISGYYRLEAAYVSESGNGDVGGATITTRDYDFASRARLAFDVKGTADNGLTYGARIRFDQRFGDENDLGTYDQAYAYILGGFGEVILGDIESAGTLLRVFAPDSAGTGVANGIWGNFAGGIKDGGHFNQFVGSDPFTIGSIGIWGDTADDVFSASENTNSYSTKIVYLTTGLDLGGFTFGFSFAPEIGNQGRNYDRLAIGAPNDRPAFENAISVGVNYTNDDVFEGVGVAVAGQYNYADSRNTNLNDYKAWMVGGQVSYLGLTVGGHYIDNGNSGSATRAGVNGNPNASVSEAGLIGSGIHFAKYTGWGAGIEYATGSWVFGFNYFSSKIDGIENDLVVDSETSPISKYQQSAYGVGISYLVAPGLTVGSDLVYYQELVSRRTPIVTPPGEDLFRENSGWIFALQTQVDF